MYRSKSIQPVTPRGAASSYEEDATNRVGARRVIIALLLSRVSRARIATVVDHDDELIFTSTIEELRDQVRTPRRALTIVCEPRDANGIPTAPLIREITGRSPAAAIIGYCPTDATSSDILALANAGIDELVQEGIDDEGIALRTAYRGSIEACAARDVKRAVRDVIPETLMPLTEYCLRYPREDHSVARLARALGVDRKTLLNHTHRHNLVAPSTLAMWCRILLAAALLEATRDPVEHVALSLEFASPSAFRNACRRYTGQRPSEWRAPGGLASVVTTFRMAVSVEKTLS